MTGWPLVRLARRSDWVAIASLLSAHQLPLAGAQAHLGAFMLALTGDTLAGVAGVEVYGSVALLRSVVVEPRDQNRGLGRTLVGAVLEEIERRGVGDVYLLTTTAPGYFQKLGFNRVSRDTAPEVLKASAEFQGACPATAVLMQLRLEAQR